MPVIYHERRRHPTWTRTSRTGLTAIPRDVHADAVTFAVDRSDGSRRAIKILDLMPQLVLRCGLARPARLAGGSAGS